MKNVYNNFTSMGEMLWLLGYLVKNVVKYELKKSKYNSS